MEMVAEFLFIRYIGKKEPLPFPEYLLPQNRYKNDFWITQEGECVHPWEMRDSHLLNIVRMIDRKNPARVALYTENHFDKYVLYGKAPWATNGGKKKKSNYIMTTYFKMWDEHRLYMLLRREIKLRGLEEHI